MNRFSPLISIAGTASTSRIRHAFRSISIPSKPRYTYRRLTTATYTQSTIASPITQQAPTVIPKSLPSWLLGCSTLVFGILVVGGLTRLTESGLSITEWQPITGILPPLTQAEWDVEWDKYKVSPEGVLWVFVYRSADFRTNSRIDRSEFKKIFYMEWAHRVAGRALGVG
jgi:cytochrome c oxidase assembly protein subunit 15